MLKIRPIHKAIKKPRIIKPVTISNHIDELNDCLIKLDAMTSLASAPELLKISVFISSINLIHFNELQIQLSELIVAHFGQDLPVISFIPEASVENFNVIFEVLLFDNTELICHIDYYHKTNSSYYIIANDDYEEIYGTTANTQVDEKGIYSKISGCFSEIDHILHENGLSLTDIHRQWSYIGHINELTDMHGKKVENYQQFNISRARHYSKYEWTNGFPSATGIGASAQGCTIEFTAGPLNAGDFVIPLHNPKQLDAHHYSNKYQVLEVKASKDNNYENTPKFERGKIVIANNMMDVYISGTAAIIGEDSIIRPVVEQTETTLQNISELYSKSNLLLHGLDIEGDLPNFSLMRVYIKNREDNAIVLDICTKYFPNVPILIVEADICRKELLVEIEAYANTLIARL